MNQIRKLPRMTFKPIGLMFLSKLFRMQQCRSMGHHSIQATPSSGKANNYAEEMRQTKLKMHIRICRSRRMGAWHHSKIKERTQATPPSQIIAQEWRIAMKGRINLDVRSQTINNLIACHRIYPAPGIDSPFDEASLAPAARRGALRNRRLPIFTRACLPHRRGEREEPFSATVPPPSATSHPST